MTDPMQPPALVEPRIPFDTLSDSADRVVRASDVKVEWVSLMERLPKADQDALMLMARTAAIGSPEQ